MMTADQCRAARGLLNWTQGDLAQAAAVGLSTVRDFEAKRRRPVHNNLLAMESALARAGVLFLGTDDAGGPGVRFHKDHVPADAHA